MEKENIKSLYDKLYANKAYTKSFDEFKTKYDNENGRHELYQKLVDNKAYTKSEDEFNDKYFSNVSISTQKQHTTTPKTEVVEQQVVEQTKTTPKAEVNNNKSWSNPQPWSKTGYGVDIKSDYVDESIHGSQNFDRGRVSPLGQVVDKNDNIVYRNTFSSKTDFIGGRGNDIISPEELENIRKEIEKEYANKAVLESDFTHKANVNVESIINDRIKKAKADNELLVKGKAEIHDYDGRFSDKEIEALNNPKTEQDILENASELFSNTIDGKDIFEKVKRGEISQDEYENILRKEYANYFHVHENRIGKKGNKATINTMMNWVDDKQKDYLNFLYVLTGQGEYNEKQQDATRLYMIKDMLTKSNDMISAAENGEGFWSGLDSGISDLSNWLSVYDAGQMLELKTISDKYNRGEKLSEIEENFLNAAAVQSATQVFYGNDLGKWYKAGLTTGASIPFMVEMMIQPYGATDKAIENGVERAIVNFAKKKYGKQFSKNIMKNVLEKGGTKFAKKAASTIATPALMTALDASKVVAGAQERMNGVSDFSIEDGAIKYNGQIEESKQDAFDAVWNAWWDSYFENMSERFFEPMKGGISHLANTTKLGKKIASNEVFNGAKKFLVDNSLLKYGHFGGMVEENAEELFGGFMKSLCCTDQTLEENFSAETLEDTFLGLLPMSIFGSVTSVGSTLFQKYYDNNNKAAETKDTSIEQAETQEDIQPIETPTTDEKEKQVVEEKQTSGQIIRQHLPEFPESFDDKGELQKVVRKYANIFTKLAQNNKINVEHKTRYTNDNISRFLRDCADVFLNCDMSELDNEQKQFVMMVANDLMHRSDKYLQDKGLQLGVNVESAGIDNTDVEFESRKNINANDLEGEKKEETTTNPSEQTPPPTEDVNGENSGETNPAPKEEDEKKDSTVANYDYIHTGGFIIRAPKGKIVEKENGNIDIQKTLEALGDEALKLQYKPDKYSESWLPINALGLKSLQRFELEKDTRTDARKKADDEEKKKAAAEAAAQAEQARIAAEQQARDTLPTIKKGKNSGEFNFEEFTPHHWWLYYNQTEENPKNAMVEDIRKLVENNLILTDENNKGARGKQRASNNAAHNRNYEQIVSMYNEIGVTDRKVVDEEIAKIEKQIFDEKAAAEEAKKKKEEEKAESATTEEKEKKKSSTISGLPISEQCTKLIDKFGETKALSMIRGLIESKIEEAAKKRARVESSETSIADKIVSEEQAETIDKEVDEYIDYLNKLGSSFDRAAAEQKALEKYDSELQREVNEQRRIAEEQRKAFESAKHTAVGNIEAIKNDIHKMIVQASDIADEVDLTNEQEKVDALFNAEDKIKNIQSNAQNATSNELLDSSIAAATALKEQCTTILDACKKEKKRINAEKKSKEDDTKKKRQDALYEARQRKADAEADRTELKFRQQVEKSNSAKDDSTKEKQTKSNKQNDYVPQVGEANSLVTNSLNKRAKEFFDRLMQFANETFGDIEESLKKLEKIDDRIKLKSNSIAYDIIKNGFTIEEKDGKQIIVCESESSRKEYVLLRNTYNTGDEVKGGAQLPEFIFAEYESIFVKDLNSDESKKLRKICMLQSYNITILNDANENNHALLVTYKTGEENLGKLFTIMPSDNNKKGTAFNITFDKNGKNPECNALNLDDYFIGTNPLASSELFDKIAPISRTGVVGWINGERKGKDGKLLQKDGKPYKATIWNDYTLYDIITDGNKRKQFFGDLQKADSQKVKDEVFRRYKEQIQNLITYANQIGVKLGVCENITWGDSTAKSEVDASFTSKGKGKSKSVTITISNLVKAIKKAEKDNKIVSRESAIVEFPTNDTRTNLMSNTEKSESTKNTNEKLNEVVEKIDKFEQEDDAAKQFDEESKKIIDEYVPSLISALQIPGVKQYFTLSKQIEADEEKIENDNKAIESKDKANTLPKAARNKISQRLLENREKVEKLYEENKQYIDKANEYKSALNAILESDKEKFDLIKDIIRAELKDETIADNNIKFVGSMLNVPSRLLKIMKDKRVLGWYDVNTGTFHIKTENIRSKQEYIKTCFHEIVGHYGLRKLIGEQEYDKLCYVVWEMMGKQNQAYYTEYVKRTLDENSSYQSLSEADKPLALRQMAADEYMAHIAENGCPRKKMSLWKKICTTIVNAVKKVLGMNIELTEYDVALLLYISRKKVANVAMTQSERAEFEEVQQKITDRFDRNKMRSVQIGGERKSYDNIVVSEEQDSDYLDAVLAGDMEKAQQMVDELAEKGGWKRSYHGTNNGAFTVIDMSKTEDEQSFFSSDGIETASTYTYSPDVKITSNEAAEYGKENGTDAELSGIKDLFVKFKNPYIVDARNSNWSTIREGKGVTHETIIFSNTENLNGEYVVRTIDISNETKTDKIFNTKKELEDYLTTTFGKEQVKDIIDGINWQIKDNEENGFELNSGVTFKVRHDVNNNIIREEYNTTNDIAYKAKQNGYDGVIIKNVVDNGGNNNIDLQPQTVYISFEPNQIKSAEAVTYAEDGSIIPLSERFNEEEMDIRYSYNTSEEEDIDLVAEELDVEEAKAEFQRQLTADLGFNLDNPHVKLADALAEWWDSRFYLRKVRNDVNAATGDKMKPSEDFFVKASAIASNTAGAFWEFKKKVAEKFTTTCKTFTDKLENDIIKNNSRAQEVKESWFKNTQRERAKKLRMLYMLAKDYMERVEIAEQTKAQHDTEIEADVENPIHVKFDGYKKCYEEWWQNVSEMLADKKFIGLTTTFNSAQEFIDYVENIVGEEGINNFWADWNNCSKFIRDYTREHNVLTQEEYDDFSKRKFYVPQRGKDSTEDTESFYDNNDISAVLGAYNELKKAEGRSSVAGDPITQLYALANSSFRDCFRQDALVALYNFFTIKSADENGVYDEKSLRNLVTSGVLKAYGINFSQTFQKTEVVNGIKQTVIVDGSMIEHKKELMKRVNALSKEYKELKEKYDKYTQIMHRTNRKETRLAYDIAFTERAEIEKRMLEIKRTEKVNEQKVLVGELIDANNALAETYNYVTPSKQDGQIRFRLPNTGEWVRLNCDEKSLFGKKIAQCFSGMPSKIYNSNTTIGRILSYPNALRRFFSQTYTTKNPYFAPKGWWRGMQSTIKLAFIADPMLGIKVATTLGSENLKGAVRNYVINGKIDDPLLQEYFEMGGNSGLVSAFKDLDAITEDIDKDIDGKNLKQKVSSFADKSLGCLGEMGELVLRFSVYKAARNYKYDGKNVYTPEEAIRIAKECDVNYDRSGRQEGLAGIISSLVPFVNASIQALGAIYNATDKNNFYGKKGANRRAAEVVAYNFLVKGFLMSAFSYWIAGMFAPDDDDSYIAQLFETINDAKSGKDLTSTEQYDEMDRLQKLMYNWYRYTNITILQYGNLKFAADQRDMYFGAGYGADLATTMFYGIEDSVGWEDYAKRQFVDRFCSCISPIGGGFADMPVIEATMTMLNMSQDARRFNNAEAAYFTSPYRNSTDLAIWLSQEYNKYVHDGEVLGKVNGEQYDIAPEVFDAVGSMFVNSCIRGIFVDACKCIQSDEFVSERMFYESSLVQGYWQATENRFRKNEDQLISYANREISKYYDIERRRDKQRSKVEELNNSDVATQEQKDAAYAELEKIDNEYYQYLDNGGMSEDDAKALKESIDMLNSYDTRKLGAKAMMTPNQYRGALKKKYIEEGMNEDEAQKAVNDLDNQRDRYFMSEVMPRIARITRFSREYDGTGDKVEVNYEKPIVRDLVKFK